MTDTPDSPELIDVSHVTCGLIPLMQTHMGGAEPEVETIEFKIRQGIEAELWSSFGTGRDWRMVEIRKELFHDVARFVRVEQNDLDPLGLMDF
jgi:hypothetical protein